jgi:hypothetical protein
MTFKGLSKIGVVAEDNFCADKNDAHNCKSLGSINKEPNSSGARQKKLYSS